MTNYLRRHSNCQYLSQAQNTVDIVQLYEAHHNAIN